MLLDGPVVNPAPPKPSEMMPALLSARPANVATPADVVTVVVPMSGPLPMASEAVIAVLLSPVSMFPYLSTS